MEKMVKKLLSVAIALAMVISWLPGNVLQASAAASENLCACGCGKAASKVEWIDLNAYLATNQGGTAGYITTDGHYYLSAPLAISGYETLEIYAAVVLDLRGKDITPLEGNRTIFVNNACVLTILDTVGGGEIYGADITASGDFGGAIKVAKNATLNMLSGVIRDGKANRGGNIHSEGTAVISGKARIVGGKANRGANLYLTNGTTTITGYAKVLDGVAETTGGNLMVQYASATLTIAGRATVAGGKAVNGVNVASMYGNVVITDNAVVDAGKTEGATSMNIAGTSGKSSTLEISGGTVYGKVDVGDLVSSVKISGAPVIRHLSLATGKLITPSNMTEGASVTVEAVDAAITDTLTDGASYLPYFHAYDSGKTVVLNNNQLQLSAGCPCGCGAANPSWTSWSGGAITASGHYQLSAATTLSGTITIGDGTEKNALNVVIDLNGNALTAASAARAFEVSAYSTLTIVDAAGSGSVTGASVTANGGTILVNNDATFNLRSGTITGGETTGYGGNIYSSGTVNIYDGTVSNGIADRGGNIKSTGTVNIYNGTITGGKATNNGGNLCNDGILRIYNGTVNAPSSTYNIFSTDENNMVYICGGKVSGGTIRTYGSNLYISGGEVGCTIECGEYKTTFGHDKSRLVISGGTITGNITVSGSTYLPEVSISGGTMGTVTVNHAHAIRLSGAPNISSLTLGSAVKIKISDLSTAASVTVTSSPVVFTTPTENPEQYTGVFKQSGKTCMAVGDFLAMAGSTSTGTTGSSGNITWTLLDGTAVVFTGTGVMSDYTTNVDPWSGSAKEIYVGEGITQIGDWAFYNNGTINYLYLPASLNNIRRYVFRQSTLSKVVYAGTRDQWNAITIPSTNTELLNIVDTAKFYCAGESNGATVVPVTPAVNTTSWSVSGNTLTISGKGQMPGYYYDTAMTRYNNAPWSAYAEQITNVVISSGVTTIGKWAFYGLKNVTSVTIPSTVINIGENAFRDCAALKSVNISGVKTIGSGAFMGCTALTTVTAGSSLTVIGNFAFRDCAALSTLTGPTAVTTLGNGVFDGCTSLTAFGNWFGGDRSVVDGVLYNKDKTILLRVPAGYSGSFTVPEGVTEVAEYALAGCTKITAITVADSVTALGGAAFDGCTAVQTLHIGAGVTEDNLDKCIFANCDSLQTFTVSPNNSELSTDAAGALTSKDKTVLYRAPSVEKYTFAKGVTGVDKCAFSCNNTVKEVTLPNTVSALGKYTFAATSNLETIHMPASMKEVQSSAFEASGVTDVYYPSTPTQWSTISIAAYNEPLTAATLHSILLTDVSCGEKVTCTLNSDGLLTISGTGSMADYTADNAPWAAYADLITTVVIEKGVTTIGANAFNGCTALTSVTTPDTITAIGDNAFLGCAALTSATYAGTEAQWGRVAKGEGNDAMTAIVTGFGAAVPVSITVTKLPDKVDYMVGDTVDPTGMEVILNYHDDTTTPVDLAECVISEVTMPGKPEITVTYGDFTTTFQVNASAEGTTGAVNWTIDANGKLTIFGEGTMGDNATATAAPWYDYMACITSLEICEGVTGTLSKHAFRNATNLASVSIPEGITRIGSSAFLNCVSLTEVVVPNSVEDIRDSAFSGCTGLKTVSIGTAMELIQANSFKNCSALTTVNYAGSRTQWDAIEIVETNNDALLNATMVYGQKSPVGADVTWAQDAKVEYYMNEELDLTGIQVTIVYDDGSEEATTEYTAVYDFSAHGTKTVAIQYKGETVYTYDVTVLPAGVSEDGFSWSVSAEGILMIVKPVEGDGEEDGNSVMTNYTEETPAPWAEVAETITAVLIGDEITTIGSNAFANCVNLTDIAIPRSVTAIGDNAFLGCTGLKKVTYSGLASEWTAITVGEGNESLTAANITYSLLYGDANGDGKVNLRDARLVLQYSVGQSVTIDVAAGDVNGDGKTNLRDARLILQYSVGQNVPLGPQ